VKYWEIIGSKLTASSWTWGYSTVATENGSRYIVDAHRGGRRFIVESDELLTALLELEATLL